ncbi:MAG: UDP-N-acetylmuramate--L-alanine ligase [Candidatus Omnitrophica bacterium]|nr:UDP-N-acetylmuramate--L-alanine ligase [Candidatus Omnitrophota bacterium]
MYKHIHFIGIGGIGMSAIAHLLLRSGVKVSGSDLKESAVTRRLKEQGADIFIGHKPENISGADLVVYSSAIKSENPEFRLAGEKGIAVMKRAEALAFLMDGKGQTVITVTGSHGKTTTASLISYLLLEAGLSPTIAVGGILKNIEANAYLGKSKFFVAEADESDGTFLYFRPDYSVITNIDYEHMDYYKESGRQNDAFNEFINRTKEGGCVFACGDDPRLRNILLGYKGEYLFFGLDQGAHVYADKISFNGLTSEFDCYFEKKCLGRFCLSLGGRHNISNALSVVALGVKLGISIDLIKKALVDYKGACRRLDLKYEGRGYTVVDDYAHHPSEIKASLSAIRDLKPQRLLVVFQPHRYSRTKLLLSEFAKCFDAADVLVITDIYAASESASEGISAESIVLQIKSGFPEKDVRYLKKEKVVAYLIDNVHKGDIIAVLGAGDISGVSDELAQILKGKDQT